MYEYPAKVLRVIDGDTLIVEIDLGFNLSFETEVRLLGVDTHEIYATDQESSEYKKGIREKKFVEQWLCEVEDDSEYPLTVSTEKKGKFGRYLAKVYRDGKCVNDVLLEQFDNVTYN